jgi:hypothetical protein
VDTSQLIPNQTIIFSNTVGDIEVGALSSTSIDYYLTISEVGDLVIQGQTVEIDMCNFLSVITCKRLPASTIAQNYDFSGPILMGTSNL